MKVIIEYPNPSHEDDELAKERLYKLIANHLIDWKFKEFKKNNVVFDRNYLIFKEEDQ